MMYVCMHVGMYVGASGPSVLEPNVNQCMYIFLYLVIMYKCMY